MLSGNELGPVGTCKNWACFATTQEIQGNFNWNEYLAAENAVAVPDNFFSNVFTYPYDAVSQQSFSTWNATPSEYLDLKRISGILEFRRPS